MIYSMTGYGKAQTEFADKKITIEIRSLNSKSFDFNARIPGFYREKELEMRSLVGKALVRGKVDLSIYVEMTGISGAQLVNSDLIRHYHDVLKGMNTELGESSDLLPTILRFPDVLRSEKEQLSDGEWNALVSGIHSAIDDLNEFRREEGRTLHEDFVQRTENILGLLADVDPHDEERKSNVQERLRKGMAALEEKNVDDNRFEQELIYYLEKLDITEEKVRLKKHCEYFMETMSQGEAQGKKLGFILQEMGREINTLGSKSNHAPMQRLVVQMKDELEKMKEQSLNIL